MIFEYTSCHDAVMIWEFPPDESQQIAPDPARQRRASRGVGWRRLRAWAGQIRAGACRAITQPEPRFAREIARGR